MSKPYEQFVNLLYSFEDAAVEFALCDKSLENNEQTYELFDRANKASEAVLEFVRGLVEQNEKNISAHSDIVWQLKDERLKQ